MRFKSEHAVMPELVASKEASRPALTKIHLDAEKSQVVATDSYMLARFPVELDEGDTSGPIPVDALKASRKPPLGGVFTAIHANGDVQVVMCDHDGSRASSPYVTLPRESGDYQFPSADQLIPDNLAEFRIAFSAKKLYELAKALTGDSKRSEVVLRFTAERQSEEEREQGAPLKPSNMRPIYVRPLRYGDDEPDGILMPIRIA